MGHHIDRLIKYNKANFSIHYPPRYINNIYFDTIDYKNYFDNIEGDTKRKKVRIRWYGEFFGINNKGKIEFKEKNGPVVRKIQKKIENFELTSKINLNKLEKIWNYKIPILKQLKPSVINRYYRKYYISNDKNIRLTIDRNQTFSKPSKPYNFKKLNKYFEPIILEIKYNVENHRKAYIVTNDLEARVRKYSKYIESIKMSNSH